LRALKSFRPEHATFYLGDYCHSILIPKISETFGILEERVLISYGEEDLLRTIFDGLETKKDSVLTQQFHYAYYKKYLDFKRIPLHIFGMKEGGGGFVFDIEDCIQQYQKLSPKVLLLTSPNNPTGNSLTAGGLEAILKRIAAQTLVIVDEAYWGFDPEYDQQAFLSLSLLGRYQNLVLLRSFSKRYALAGLRIGFALCGANVKNLLRYQSRYLGLSRILEEVAVAALESEDYYSKLSQEIIEDREDFITESRNLRNFQPFNSRSNFVLMRIAHSTLAERLRVALTKEGVVISKFVSEDLVRVSIGKRGHTKKFLRLLRALA